LHKQKQIMKEKLEARKKELVEVLTQQANHIQKLRTDLNSATEEFIAMQGALQMLNTLLEEDKPKESKEVKNVKEPVKK
jgi:RNA polymerase-binding transcription factor DksA